MGRPRIFGIQILDEVDLARDVAAIRQSIKELDAGKGREAKAFFRELRKELLSKKAAYSKGHLE